MNAFVVFKHNDGSESYKAMFSVSLLIVIP